MLIEDVPLDEWLEGLTESQRLAILKLIRVFVLENVPAGAVAMSFADAKRMLLEMAPDDRARSVRFIRKRIGL